MHEQHAAELYVHVVGRIDLPDRVDEHAVHLIRLAVHVDDATHVAEYAIVLAEHVARFLVRAEIADGGYGGCEYVDALTYRVDQVVLADQVVQILLADQVVQLVLVDLDDDDHNAVAVQKH